MSTPQVIIIRTSYTEAQKRATCKWLASHPEKVKEYRKTTYERRKARRQEEMGEFINLTNLCWAVEYPEYHPKRKYERKKITLPPIVKREKVGTVYDPLSVTPTEQEQSVVSSPSPTEEGSC